MKSLLSIILVAICAVPVAASAAAHDYTQVCVSADKEYSRGDSHPSDAEKICVYNRDSKAMQWALKKDARVSDSTIGTSVF